MSPYIVPDHVLELNIPTSLTPTFWGALTIVPFDSLATDSPQSTAIFKNNLVPTSSKGSENTLTPLFEPVNLPTVRHHRLYFDDGNITFRVQGILYRLHRSVLCRGSGKFEDLISQLSKQQETSDSDSTSSTIPLDDVKFGDFNAFLSILYPQDYNALEKRTFEEWSAILDLSTRWGFTSIRDLAIRCICIRPVDPLKKLLLARKHNIDAWIQPALCELCTRLQPLSLEEARLMEFEDVILVGSVRQTARSSTLTVGEKGIMSCIQAWQNREPWVKTPQESRNPVPVTPDGLGTASAQPTADEYSGWGASTSQGKKKGKKR